MDGLRAAGVQTELIKIKSSGDQILHIPLYELGVTGIFTKELDIALLDRRVDIAVHSLKDIPTQLARGLAIAAVMERDSSADILVHKGRLPVDGEPYTVATSSLRRRAQWLRRYPHHEVIDIRGNVNSRLAKLDANPSCDAIILAQAGLDRLGITSHSTQVLDWMISAPSQGAIAVVCRASDQHIRDACSALDHAETRLHTSIERAFLRELMGGCSMPIAARARQEDESILFHGCVHTLDGNREARVDMSFHQHDTDIAQKAAAEIRRQGADQILAEIRSHES